MNLLLATDLRKGMKIQYNNSTYEVLDSMYVKPGKGRAVVKTELKNLTNGNVIKNTFDAAERFLECE